MRLHYKDQMVSVLIEIIVVHSENHTKPNFFYSNEELLDVTVRGTYSYHRAGQKRLCTTEKFNSDHVFLALSTTTWNLNTLQ